MRRLTRFARLVHLTTIARRGRPGGGHLPTRRGRHQLRRWIAVGWAAGTIANGLRLRSRLSHLPVLPDTPPPGDLARRRGHLVVLPSADAAEDDEFELLVAPGVVVGDATRWAAVRFARDSQLDVVDLVPGDLPVGPLLELARMVDPKTYRHDRLAPGRSAGHATLVRTELVDRLGLERWSSPGTGLDAGHHDGLGRDEGLDHLSGVDLRRRHELDPVAYADAIVQLKRCAPASMDLVVAPRLRAVETGSGWRLPRLRALVGSLAPVYAAGPGVSGVLVGLVAGLGRTAGATAAVAAVAQPVVATAALPVRPRDLRLPSLLSRPGREIVASVEAFQAPLPEAEQERQAEAARARQVQRATYAELLAQRPGFVEPRRATCPWCGSHDLHHLLTVPDLLQRKPGRFRLDECDACGHVFQNPRLSLAGLDFYYRDCYDGLGNETTELFFSHHRDLYRRRASLVGRFATPKRWLDVGTGYGHFCLMAQEVLPDTRFDGLDLSDSVVEAQRRGWIERAHHGLLPDLAPDLTGAYDVVSMHHYLEHTREPFDELDAARTVLEAGGHLLIEVPDPESRLSRRLGWASVHWFQPQHQHLIPLGNLVDALVDRGFTVVATQRGAAHQRHDLAAALGLVANRLAPAGDEPWLPRPTPSARAARAATLTGFAPLCAAALAVDHAAAPLLRRMHRMTNAYRVLARRT